MRRRALIALVILGGLAGVAWARPGGGNSYSGGGGHSSGGGGGGGAIFELIFHLIRLVIYDPQIGLPIVMILVGWVAYSSYKQRQNKDWDSGPPVQLKRAVELADVRQIDPDFSQVVFEDFAFRLFSTAHRARATPETLATVAPYVGEAARQALAQRQPVGEVVESVVVGAMRAFRVDVPARPTPGARVRVGIEFEANVTTAKHTYFSVETWLFGRDATRTSKPPGASKTFPCPNCGAPWQAAATGTQVCASCNQAVDNGRFDWVVEQISLSSIDERPPTLTNEVPERGNDLLTYRQADCDVRWMQLQTADPALTTPTLLARLTMIYEQLNAGWARNDLGPARGVVSDGLDDYFAYWIDAYKRQGLRNALEGMRITNTAMAKVMRDRWYDSVTIRIWGTGRDYVLRTDTGALVRGSKHRERPYSEYWTLIRSAARRGPAVASPSCGNCGAPLQITQSGECTHCSAHVTAGEFDWVLSKIEQDDSYRG